VNTLLTSHQHLTVGHLMARAHNALEATDLERRCYLAGYRGRPLPRNARLTGRDWYQRGREARQTLAQMRIESANADDSGSTFS